MTSKLPPRAGIFAMLNNPLRSDPTAHRYEPFTSVMEAPNWSIFPACPSESQILETIFARYSPEKMPISYTKLYAGLYEFSRHVNICPPGQVETLWIIKALEEAGSRDFFGLNEFKIAVEYLYGRFEGGTAEEVLLKVRERLNELGRME